MSVREKLISELLSLGRDGHELLAIIESQFVDIKANQDRVRLAREILGNTGLTTPQLAKLAPLLTRFVLDYAEIVQPRFPEQAIEGINETIDDATVMGQVRKKKPRKKILTGKDLQELFDLRGPTMIQRYSDDEGAPKPVIVRVNKPSIMVSPKPATSSKPTRQVVDKSTAWEDRPAVVPTAPLDYGGFW